MSNFPVSRCPLHLPAGGACPTATAADRAAGTLPVRPCDGGYRHASARLAVAT